MKKILALPVLAIVIVASAAVAFTLLSGTPTSLVMTEDFEGTQSGELGEWVANADIPRDPNNPGNLVQWHIRLATNVSRSPTHSAEFFIDGTQDDGTIWLERKIIAEKNTQVRVSVSFWFYSRDESFNVIAGIVVYAGIAKPTVEGAFAVVGNANEAAGWKNYVYVADVNTDSTGEAYVAVGITVSWETTMTYYIDDIVIE